MEDPSRNRRIQANRNVLSIIWVLFVIASTNSYAQKPAANWTVRHINASTEELFKISVPPSGMVIEATGKTARRDTLFVSLLFKLDSAITALTFDYASAGDVSEMPITLYDVAGHALWQYSGRGPARQQVILENINARGLLVFRVHPKASGSIPAGVSHRIMNFTSSADTRAPIRTQDGFIVIDSLNELRGYASADNMKLRLTPGTYPLSRALFRHFIEFTGNHNHYDLTGVKLRADTVLFRQFGRAGGPAGIYCVLGISGHGNVMEGLEVETVGNQYGVSGRNKLFNITGSNNTLRNCLVRTHGSNPWGYGSLFGIGGGDVRKMNGIRVGWPARDTKLIGCRVEMRAMGHAIFVQGAQNTLIEDCHVEGLLRLTDSILLETSGYAVDRNFTTKNRHGYVEGVTVGNDGRILPGEISSLSEDGIRMYPRSARGQDTGSTTIKDCTVTNMRRGICTGLSAAGDRVINCQTSNCIATGFNVGSEDVLINCRADAKYSEALCLTGVNSHHAQVELEILNSRGGLANNLLAKVNGNDHRVVLRTVDPDFIPNSMRIELATNAGYCAGQRGDKCATRVTLTNETYTPITLLPGATGNRIASRGSVTDEDESDNTIVQAAQSSSLQPEEGQTQ